MTWFFVTVKQIKKHIMTLSEAQRHIDSFSRPQGFNVYSWRAVKKMAISVWRSYLNGTTHERSYNFMCKEFYEMTRDINGQSILSRRIQCHFPDLVS